MYMTVTYLTNIHMQDSSSVYLLLIVGLAGDQWVLYFNGWTTLDDTVVLCTIIVVQPTQNN